jgi:hypothetical protein
VSSQVNRDGDDDDDYHHHHESLVGKDGLGLAKKK